MFAPIPLPSTENPQFKDVMDYLETIRARKQQLPLIEAQTQEAQANALKSQMFANLIKAAFGGGEINQNDEQYELSDVDRDRINNMQPGDTVVVGQDQGQPSSYQRSGNPSQNRAKEMLYALGMLKETPSEQAQREMQTAYQKELGASDVKTMEKWNDVITASHEILPVLQDIHEVSANPAFQKMYNNPQYFGYDLKLLKRFGTPEQQQLLARVGTNAKSIFQGMSQEFKGAFREFELNLFNKAAPDEVNDTLPQLVAKTQTLLALRNLASQRLTMAQNIVRSSGGRIAPANALAIADKEVNGKQIRNQIEQQFKQMELAQKEARQQATKNVIPNQYVFGARNDSKIQVRNKKTGEMKFISKEEAKKLGVI